jgi:serine/threonine-protein kinase
MKAEALDALLQSVADGYRADGPGLEAAALHEARRRQLLYLSIAAAVADSCGSDDDDEMDDEEDPQSEPPSCDEPLRRWGHLELLDKIGAGAYGDVYRARDVRLDTEVAVKLLKPRPGENIPLSRLLDEARALARVRHEQVVAVHGASVHEGRAGLWMQLLTGRTLGELLRARGPFSATDAVRIGRQLCAALGAVHDAGVVHGDIKAENVMQEPDGRLVLMDFGASRLADGPARDRGPAGTPLYVAPEVLDGNETTIQSDLYALGVLLYRLVTGTYPVNAVSLEGLIAAHATGKPQTLREVRPDLPAWFVAVIDRALARDPDDRFPSAQAMQEALAGPKDRARWRVAFANRASGLNNRKLRSTTDWRAAAGGALEFGWSRA